MAYSLGSNYGVLKNGSVLPDTMAAAKITEGL
jgi:hypothetical protein